MRVIKLNKQNLIPFLELISKEKELWGPVKKGDKYAFEVIDDFNKLQLYTTRTILPPKKIFIPPTFNMFNVTPKGYQNDFSHVKKRIIFGVHPCDIHGLLILDKLFGQKYPDPYYLEARKQTIILGLSCWPDEHCFAKSTNTHIVEEGFDLFFTDLETYFLVWVGSSIGDDLIKLNPKLFDENLTFKDIQNFIDWQIERNKAYKLEINFIGMPDLMELRYHDPIWEKIGGACLSCGSCSMVCPTCNCFNVVDKNFLGKETSKRFRSWDSCTLPEYSEIAGGENFRKNRSDRLKLWYIHKLQAFVSKYGKPACVGCGRCLVTCPVDINVVTVSRALQGEDVDAFWNKMSKEVTNESRK